MFILYSGILFGQTTSYYRLYKIVEYNKETTICNGGQFVRISKNTCYDADCNGNYVGNGKLYRDVGNSSTSHVYIGNSYHGKVKYLFSDDYSSLTVEITPKFKYFYKKSVPPKGVVTCSLMKPQNNGGDGAPNSIYQANDYLGNNYYTNNYPTQNMNGGGNSNSSRSTTQTARKFKCAYCNGGRIERNDNAPANFGQPQPRQRCNECGKW